MPQLARAGSVNLGVEQEARGGTAEDTVAPGRVRGRGRLACLGRLLFWTVVLQRRVRALVQVDSFSRDLKRLFRLDTFRKGLPVEEACMKLFS